jgi:hypothetical protein
MSSEGFALFATSAKTVASSGDASRTESLDFAVRSRTPLDVKIERSLSSHDSWQICWASLVPDASKASVGRPSTSRVKTRENATFISLSLSADRLELAGTQMALLLAAVDAGRALRVVQMGQ